MKLSKVLILALIFSTNLSLSFSQSSESLNTFKDKSWSDLVYLGLSYEHSAKSDKAIKSYQKSIKIQENSLALFRLAKAYRRLGRYRQAADIFLRLIKVDSSLRLAYYYLGDCLAKQGRDSQAYQHLSKAINFYPEARPVRKLLDKVKKTLGEDFFAAKKKLIDKQRQQVKLTAYSPKPEISQVSVGLSTELKQFSFSCPSRFVASDGKVSFSGEPKIIYTVILESGRLILKDYQSNKEQGVFLNQIRLFSSDPGSEKYPFYILDITYGKGNFWHKTVDRAYRGDIEAVAEKGVLTLINRLSVEEYLYGVLAAEIPPNSHPQALKSQAVAARTLVFKNRGRHKKDGFDFCSDVHCQVYQGVSAETAATIRAVDETSGQILEFDGQPIEAFYHSNCGGCLASDVFGQEKYLANKLDFGQGSFDEISKNKEKWFLEPPETFCSRAKASNYRWQRIYDPEDFLIAFGFKLADLKEISSKESGECFHHKEIEVVTVQGKKILRGDLTIRNYFDNLRSSAFIVEIKAFSAKVPKFLIFWGAGFGHGTGLCQEGAISMAEKNYTYQEILKHYYPKASLRKLY
ncbi:MAG: SpoIID/LytB domain-containing protein [Candidatus Omnitrophica bacterium]|nr:SpoIID/LytB domain-containing protein [Candidatus Omnitrophota bacterium]